MENRTEQVPGVKLLTHWSKKIHICDIMVNNWNKSRLRAKIIKRSLKAGVWLKTLYRESQRLVLVFDRNIDLVGRGEFN